MSYEIVKAIKIEKNMVHIKSDSNNVSPREFYWWHAQSFTKILNEEGRDALDKAILYEYWAGNFRGTRNNYEKSLILADFTRHGGYGGLSDETIKEVLFEGYQKFSKRKFGTFIVETAEGFLTKITPNRMKYSYAKDRAKTFISFEDAQFYARDAWFGYDIKEVA